MRVSILLVLLALAGCNKVTARAPVAPAQSVVSTADPQSAGQLTDGFYPIEDGAWRWTGKKFSVLLRTPHGAATRGATLVLNLAVPAPLIQHTRGITVTCAAAGTPLREEHYDQPGKYTLSRELESPIAASTAAVTCNVDKTFKPDGNDARELGVIVASIGLISR
jgi:hypothetical protein